MLGKELLLRITGEAGWSLTGFGFIWSIAAITIHSKDDFAADFRVVGTCIIAVGVVFAMVFAHVMTINTSLYRKVVLILMGMFNSAIFYWIMVSSHRASTEATYWFLGYGTAILLARILIALLVDEARTSNTNHQGNKQNDTQQKPLSHH